MKREGKKVGRIKSEKLNEQGGQEKQVSALENKSVECEKDETNRHKLNYYPSKIKIFSL